jgi:hypothetical protein
VGTGVGTGVGDGVGTGVGAGVGPGVGCGDGAGVSSGRDTALHTPLLLSFESAKHTKPFVVVKDATASHWAVLPGVKTSSGPALRVV